MYNVNNDVLDAGLRYWTGFPGDQYGNSPRVQVLLDHIPPSNSYVYREKGGIYYAECDGVARFYYKMEPDVQEDGFAGRHFTLQMQDGSDRVLKGPWSSNAGAVCSKGFGPCIEAVITDDPLAWKRGYTFSMGAITIPLLQKALGIISLRRKGQYGFACLLKGPYPTICEVKGRAFWGRVFEHQGKRLPSTTGKLFPDLSLDQLGVADG